MKRKRPQRLFLSVLGASALLLALITVSDITTPPSVPEALEDYVLYPLDMTAYALYRIFGVLVFPLPVFVITAAVLSRYSSARGRRSPAIVAMQVFLLLVLMTGLAGIFFSSVDGGFLARSILLYLEKLGGTILLIPLILGCGLSLYPVFTGNPLRRIFQRDRASRRYAGLGETPAAIQPIVLDLAPLPMERRLCIPEEESAGLQPQSSRETVDAISDRVARLLLKHQVPLLLREQTCGHGTLCLKYEIREGHTLSEVARKRDDLLFHLADLNPVMKVPIPNETRVGLYFSIPETRTLTVDHGLHLVSRSAMTLPVYAGLTVEGEHRLFDLAEQPHILVAGATGSGKSSFLVALVLSLLTGSQAHRVRFVFIDPKRVELVPFRTIPHCACPTVTEPEEADTVLQMLLLEMERRYKLLERAACRSIGDYNRLVPGGDDLGYAIVVIDEAADLLLSLDSTARNRIIQLAQKARAVGMHIVLATQRPSVEIITGLIKANFPARVAFRTASKTDSRIILDEDGAEKLNGRGDGLLKTVGLAGAPIRFQVPFVPAERLIRLLSMPVRRHN